MPTWLRRILSEGVGFSWPAIVVVPPLASALALAEIARQQWISQGLWFVALSHSVYFVVEAVFVAILLLLGTLATVYATAPGRAGLPRRAPAILLSWLLLVYPLKQVLTPTFRGLLMSQENASFALKIPLAIPLSIVSTTVVWILLCRAIWSLRSSRDAGGDSRPLQTPEFRPWAMLPASALLGAMLLVSAAAPLPAGRANHVLLIVIDTLRADHLGAYGYSARSVSPNLDELAKDSVIYRNAVSTAPWTTPSVASILTSRYPRRLGYGAHPVFLAPREISVAEAFLNNGYRTHAITSNMFASRGVGFNAGFETMDASLVAGQLDVTSRALTDHAINWLSRNRKAPFFLYLHYFDPHFAYLMQQGFDFAPDYRGPFRVRLTHAQFTAKLADIKPVDLDYLTASYDSEIALTDQELGRLMRWLRDNGLYENTMIVVVSDHGEELDDRGENFVGHARTVQEELLHVPLLVKNPGEQGAGRQVESRVSTLDIAPTMLASAGAAFPPVDQIDGQALDTVTPDRILVAETRREADLRAVYRGRWKLIVDREAHSRRLYDLEADPGERSDVAGSHREIVDQLDDALESWETSLGETSGASAQFSNAATEKLKALGYWQ